MNFNGWEFLKWQLPKKEVEKILSEKGLSLKYTNPDAKVKRTRIDYQGMDTILFYNSLNQLNNVKQSKDFHVTEAEEAKKFFDKIKNYFVQKFGKPDKNINDKQKETITMVWNLKYKRIIIKYDYKYKIIDELGCGSYRVDIHISPN